MKSLIYSVLAIGVLASSCINEEQTELKIKYESNGYLDQNSVPKIRAEHLKIKAISAYEYALPIVGLEQWHQGFLMEAEHGDWLVYKGYESKIPILTANTTTPYVISFLDLSETSYYVEIPAGPIGGLVIDIYQSPVSDLGVVGPDQGKGGTYLLLGPHATAPKKHKADYVIQSSSNLIFLGTRIIGLEGEAYQQALRKHQIYPITQDGINQVFIDATNAPKWMGDQPHGLAYWKMVNDVLQNEPVVDRNRFILTQLRGTGIEKEKPFNPSEYQKSILIEAEEMGNAIAMVNTFSRESYKERHWPDRNWLYILNMEYLNQYAPNYYEVQEIASYTYEAITTSKGMVLNNIGSGSKYLGAYIDDQGNWLDGKHTYEFVIPKDAPANQFWSITIYDNDTRCIIQNAQGQSDISSVMKGLKTEKDGSVKVYVGPQAPEGYEKNWIQSNPEKGFFAYLRLYGPLESYYDKSWKMPDVKKVN
ncbi:MAG: DUF1254 domain-containing protein [Flavobacteriaceae bacterium]